MLSKSRRDNAMSVARYLVIIAASLVVHNEASRILAVFPTPSISHQVVFRPFILELVKRGHEVVMLTTDPIFKKGQGPANLTEIDVHDMSYKIWRDEFVHASLTSGNKDDWKGQMVVMFKTILKVVEQQIWTNEMQTLLNDKSQKFDLLILEGFVTPLLGLTTIFTAPVIQMSSFGSVTDLMRIVGGPIHPLVYPTCLQRRTYNYTFFEKIKELYDHYNTEIVLHNFATDGEKTVKRVFGSNAPSLRELTNRVDMLFFNVHPVWEYNRPVPPNVIYMGGLHQNPEKALPQDLKTFLDSSKHGVIYISFGTNVEPAQLPPEKIQALINVFAKLPFDVLWKWNQDELPGRTKNIRISKWLPQSDLLRHPNVKLFITQGGLQSTDEAITAGVPLIGMPMLGDQWFNVEQYERNKIGLRVDMETMTEEKLEHSIQTILSNKSYRDNIVRLRAIMQDQPQTPLERAAWWTEYVLRHGGAKHLRSPAANMPLTEYLEIELISYLFFGLLSVIVTLSLAVYYLYNILYKHHKLSVKLKSK